jgi:hypothetical protein
MDTVSTQGFSLDKQAQKQTLHMTEMTKFHSRDSYAVNIAVYVAHILQLFCGFRFFRFVVGYDYVIFGWHKRAAGAEEGHVKKRWSCTLKYLICCYFSSITLAPIS